MKRILLTIIAFIVLTGGIRAQVENTPNTLKLSEGASGEKATIADMEWIAGSWIGTGLGGVSEETWSKQSRGIMIGTYRLLKENKAVFYEMMWLMEQEGTLILRLKHFRPDLVGWEEKDKTVDFKYVKRDGKRIHFSGLTFENAGSGEMNIFLALRQKDGMLKEEVFRMKRATK